LANSYCEFIASGKANPFHVLYHDDEYGFAVASDDALFERLVLEINQAGLSWDTILRRREAFRNAYAGFSIEAVAAFGPADEERLLSDPGVIRNRAKVSAAIENARRIQAIQSEHGSFGKWLDGQTASSLDEWVKLFRATFKFTGPEIVREFLVSCGYLPGAHDPDCPAYGRAVASNPPHFKKLSG
jgi:DNA-3-methyladenine glycosylase I